MTRHSRVQVEKSSVFLPCFLAACLLMVTIGLMGCPPPAAPPAPQTPLPGIPTQTNTDGYNYLNYRDGVGDFVYITMWNFSFLDDRDTPDDATDDIYGVAAFGLANPESLMGSKGLTNSLGLIIRPESEGASFTVNSPYWDPAVVGNFTASTTFEPGPGYEFVNPAGYIDVISEDEYHLFGHVHDGIKTASWDLTYTRGLGPSWLPWVEWPFPATLGLYPAWMTYGIQMPNAIVNGTYTVDDGVNPEVTYVLDNVKGYHDSLYGEAVFSDIAWDWLDYKQSDISVHMLHPHAPVYSCDGGWETCTPGNLRVFYDGQEYNFVRGKNPSEAQIEIIYNATSHDADYNLDYPVDETVIADNGVNRLVLNWTYAQHVRVYYDVPDPFKDNVTYEMLVMFDGTFYETDGSGGWVPLTTIHGSGFADWGSPPVN